MPLLRINDSILHIILACKLMVVYNEDGFSNENVCIQYIYSKFITYMCNC